MAWLTKKGFVPPNTDPQPRPRFEGSVNLPPMWFAHADTWAQWFAEIHDPGPRNWIQSASTSEVRPPKMVAALKAGVVLASIHFDNIAEIQRSLERLRTPKWPEPVLGGLDRAKVDEGGQVYEQTVRRVSHTNGPAAQQPGDRVPGAACIRRRDGPHGLSAIRGQAPRFGRRA